MVGDAWKMNIPFELVLFFVGYMLVFGVVSLPVLLDLETTAKALGLFSSRKWSPTLISFNTMISALEMLGLGGGRRELNNGGWIPSLKRP